MDVQHALGEGRDKFFGKYLAVGDTYGIVVVIRRDCSNRGGIQLFRSEYRDVFRKRKLFDGRRSESEAAPCGRVRRGYDESRNESALQKRRERFARYARRPEVHKSEGR